MGYYLYIQTCEHGHSWTAAFMSFNMTSTKRESCPECGSTKIKTRSTVLNWEQYGT